MLEARLRVTLPRCCDNQARVKQFADRPGGTPVERSLRCPRCRGLARHFAQPDGTHHQSEVARSVLSGPMPAPTLSRDAVEVYVGAVDWLRGILSRAEVVESWGQPSAVEHYSIGGVAAHAVHGVLWLEQVLKDAEPVGLKRVKIPDYMGLNRVDGEHVDPFGASLLSAAEVFAETGAHIVAAALTVSRNELATLLEAAPASRAVPVFRVTGACAPLSEYLQTRVLEAIVHGDDVASSVPDLQVPDPPSRAVTTCLDVCLEMARARVGDLDALRAFARVERATPDALRVF